MLFRNERVKYPLPANEWLSLLKITKAHVVVSGFQEALLRLLKGWRPPPMQNEFEYRDSLYECLRAALPDDTAVEKEYRHGGTNSDLYVRWKSLREKGQVLT